MAEPEKANKSMRKDKAGLNPPPAEQVSELSK